MGTESLADVESGIECSSVKRARDDGCDAESGDASKKARVEMPFEEKGPENVEGSEDGEGGRKADERSGPVTLGPKSFCSSADMFDYFYKLLHFWTPNVDINKYEHMVLLELLMKGHPEPQKKIGEGVSAFQVRNHAVFKTRYFFILRVDGSEEDFSFRKCVDHILPLPENMQVKHNANKALGGGGKGGRGRGRGGRGGGQGRGCGT